MFMMIKAPNIFKNEETSENFKKMDKNLNTSYIKVMVNVPLRKILKF